MYLLDTNFIINLYNRKQNELSFLLNNKVDFSQCAISVITRLEVLGFTGNSQQDKQNLSLLLAKLECIELSFPIQEKTINIREQRKIKLPDAIILATALMTKRELVTSDKKLISAYNQFS